jgi:DDE superfamily endonuclease
VPKAAFVLDLYAGEWDGHALLCDELVASADEKTSIQARIRCHRSMAAPARHPTLVRHEYERGAALQPPAAWDVHRAKHIGRYEPGTCIELFRRLVDQDMTAESYRSARRAFWVLDNGSSHQGEAAVRRLVEAYPRLAPVHLPVHAGWLNSVEIYFSIVERTVLTPTDATSLERLAAKVLAFQVHREVLAQPFEWKLARADLARLLERLTIRGSGRVHKAA